MQRLHLGVELDVSAEFQTHYTLYPSDTNGIEIALEKVKTLAVSFTDAENALQIASAPLLAQIAKSPGRGSSGLELEQSVRDTLKTSIEEFSSCMQLTSDVVGTVKHGCESVDDETGICSELTDLCYAAVSTAIQIAAEVLGTELHYSLGNGESAVVIGAEIPDGDCAEKYKAVAGVVSVLADVIESITQFVSPPEHKTMILSEVKAIKRRYRLLYELDPDDLDDYDAGRCGLCDFIKTGVKEMLYIKLDENMNLVITKNEPIYRGDHMNRKIIYLIPIRVGDIDMLTATVYLSYIRADGTADIALLVREEEKYNEGYYQYHLPVISTMSRYAGEICTFLQIFSGPPRCPVIAKSGECVLRVIDSKNMDEYITDRNLRMIYEMQRYMEDKIEKAETLLHERIDDETTQNLGRAVGKDGVVYVPHVDEHKVLTFTIESEPGEIPGPVDMNPNDEWSDIGGDSGNMDSPGIKTSYVWEDM